MIYLILAVLCSASMAIALRLGQTFSKNQYGILFGNYLTCTITAFLLLPDKNLIPAGGGTAAAAGLADGVIFLATLVLMQRSIGKNGAVLSAAFSKLGIMLPVAASILLLGERPTVLQTIGMALVVAAILVINLEKGEHKIASKPLLLLLFIVSGSADGMSKVFETIGERQFDALFLFYTFLTALVLCGVLLAVSRKKGGGPLQKGDLLAGIFVGIPNYFSTSLLLAAVARMPACLAYPCFSVGTILVVSFVSVLLLKDRMSRRQAAGCGLIMGALVLLNL